MNRSLLFFAGMLFSIGLQAQQCTDESVKSLPGKWVTSYGTLEPAEKNLVLFINKTIQESFKWSPVGGDLRLGGSSLGSVDRRPMPVSKICGLYESRFSFPTYICTKGGIIHDEPSVLFSVMVNDLPFEFSQTAYTPRPDAKDPNDDPDSSRFATLGWLPEVKDGYFDYIDDQVDGSGEKPGKMRRYRVLFKPGKLPYAVMTKKECYEMFRRYYLGQIAIAKATRKKAEIDLKGTEGLSEFLKSLDQSTEPYQKWVDAIDNNLKNRTTEELAKPAYQGDEQGEYHESRQASDYLRPYFIRPNLDYYDKKLPKSSPQVITMGLRYIMGVDENGNKHHVDEGFYKGLTDMNIFELLTAKLKPFLSK